jgi:hypothetical protein
MTKDPEAKEFILIIQFAEKGNLKRFLSSDFNNHFIKENMMVPYH